MSRKRILTIIAVLALMIVAAGGSWILGSSIKSPAEVAARTAPPEPSPILVPVESKVLSSDVVTRGTARYGVPLTLSLAPSVLKQSTAGVISTLPTVNSQLKEGDVLLSASGRPVFLLEGEVPVFRDLIPGMFGKDVAQLEASLERLGFNPGPVDGTYDAATSDAVKAWYSAAGWEPFGPRPEQLAALRTLEQDLVTATNTKLAADDALARAGLSVEAARAKAADATAIATANVTAKQVAMDTATVDPSATANARTNAEAEFAAARTTLTATQLAGEVEIQAAVDAQHAAERDAIAANEMVQRLTADLGLIKSKTGVQVPSDEIVFVPTLPVRVEQVLLLAGDAAIGAVVKVTNNQLFIDTSLRLEEAPLVKAGMKVTIDEPDLGLKATGVVKTVADSPGTMGVDGFHIYCEIQVDETKLSLAGSSLRLKIPIESSGGAVLAVPISALSLATDGTSRVQVDRSGTLEFLTVEPGLSADGFVAITPVEGNLEAGQLVVVGYEAQQ
jgi:peptidoglycan hydrolase-like protein with peptidoglycan-binding domain